MWAEGESPDHHNFSHQTLGRAAEVHPVEHAHGWLPRRIAVPSGRGIWPGPRLGPDLARLPAQDQKSMLACGSVVAAQNSVILPSRIWLTLATGTSTDLPPREADSVHSATVCSSLASTS